MTHGVTDQEVPVRTMRQFGKRYLPNEHLLDQAGIDEFHGRYLARATGAFLTFDRATAIEIAKRLCDLEMTAR